MGKRRSFLLCIKKLYETEGNQRELGEIPTIFLLSIIFDSIMNM